MIIYSRPVLGGATPIQVPTGREASVHPIYTQGFTGAPAAPKPTTEQMINPHGTGSYYVPGNVPPASSPSSQHGSGGDAGSYIRYPIGASRWGAELRSAFEIAGASGWELASEIVPVYVVNSEEDDEEAPFAHSYGASIVPAAGNHTMAGIYNNSTDKVIRIDRVLYKTTGTATHIRAVRRHGMVTQGANSGTESLHYWGRTTDAGAGLMHYGEATTANLHTAGNPIIGYDLPSTTNINVFVAKPKALVLPGQAFYVYANITALAALLIGFEGAERPA